MKRPLTITVTLNHDQLTKLDQLLKITGRKAGFGQVRNDNYAETIQALINSMELPQ